MSYFNEFAKHQIKSIFKNDLDYLFNVSIYRVIIFRVIKLREISYTELENIRENPQVTSIQLDTNIKIIQTHHKIGFDNIKIIDRADNDTKFDTKKSYKDILIITILNLNNIRINSYSNLPL